MPGQEALLTVQLDRLGRNAGVRAFTVHPGKTFTSLRRYLTENEMLAAGWIDADGKATDLTFKIAQQGAATQMWAACSPQLKGMDGLYCEDCDIATLDAGESSSFIGVRPYAVDPEKAERLWTLSAMLTGIDTFAMR